MADIQIFSRQRMKSCNFFAMLTVILLYHAFVQAGWSIVTPPPTDRTLMHIVFENGRFIAVGINGTIIESTDGVSWFACSSGVSFDLRSVALYDNQFFAVGDGIISSENGVTWKVISTEYGLYDIAGGDSCIVAVGKGKILTSKDGITWSKHDFSGIQFNAVAWGMNKFIAGGDSSYWDMSLNFYSRMFSSSDGNKWTDVSILMRGNTVFDLEWAGDQFIDAETNGISFSLDGLGWQVSWSLTGTQTIHSVRWLQNNIFAILNCNQLFYHDSVSGWKSFATFNEYCLEDIACGIGYLVAVGQNGVIITFKDIESVQISKKPADYKDILSLNKLKVGNTTLCLNEYRCIFNPLGRKISKTAGDNLANGLYVIQK
jgi:hypothetical protein